MLPRRFLPVALMVLFLFSLAACSTGAPAGSPNGSEATLTAGALVKATSPAGSQAQPASTDAADAASPSAATSGQNTPTAALPVTGPTTVPTQPAAPTTAPTGQDAPAAPPAASPTTQPATPQSCQPTPPDALGPFYVPGAPERSQVGQGYVLTGVVRSADGCTPIPGAMVELWMAGPDGEYADAYRATILTGPDGAYRFESHIPPPYSGRPPHIHLRATAQGYGELVTQHYPSAGQTQAAFDLVLTP